MPRDRLVVEMIEKKINQGLTIEDILSEESKDLDGFSKAMFRYRLNKLYSKYFDESMKDTTGLIYRNANA